MLQTLLAERFKLKTHRETNEMAVYALVVDKDGPKLERADIEEKNCQDASVNTAPGIPATAATVLWAVVEEACMAGRWICRTWQASWRIGRIAHW